MPLVWPDLSCKWEDVPWWCWLGGWGSFGWKEVQIAFGVWSDDNSCIYSYYMNVKSLHARVLVGIYIECIYFANMVSLYYGWMIQCTSNLNAPMKLIRRKPTSVGQKPYKSCGDHQHISCRQGFCPEALVFKPCIQYCTHSSYLFCCSLHTMNSVCFKQFRTSNNSKINSNTTWETWQWGSVKQGEQQQYPTSTQSPITKIYSPNMLTRATTQGFHGADELLLEASRT